MNTYGGDWTLVWSYSFTNYTHLNDGSNAITPRPDWPAKNEVNAPIFITPPLNETDYDTMNFSHWKQLGRQVLIKSKINNWLVCHPGPGACAELGLTFNLIVALEIIGLHVILVEESSLSK